MKVVNSYAAGVDVGSCSHWVARGQREQDVRKFGVFNQDLFELADWFNERQVKTIAMESTWIYWHAGWLGSVKTTKKCHKGRKAQRFTKAC